MNKDNNVSECKIGRTTYIVKLVFNPASKERLTDILQRLIDRECEEIIAHNEKIRKNIHVVFQQLDKIRESRLDQITVTFRRSKRFLLSPVPPECSGDESASCSAGVNGRQLLVIVSFTAPLGRVSMSSST